MFCIDNCIYVNMLEAIATGAILFVVFTVRGEDIIRLISPELRGERTLQRATAPCPPFPSYYWLISVATASPYFFWISFWVSGSKSVM